MDLRVFIHVVDPTKVRVVERELAEGEVKLLDSTVGRVVPLLPVAPARAESELEASVNKLFDEDGNADQGNFATGDTAAVTAERPKRHRKKRLAVTDASVIIEVVITAATAGISSAPIRETSAKVNTPVHASMFHDSDPVGTVKPDVAGPSHLPGKELSLGSREVDSEHLHEVLIPRWNISNDALLDDLEPLGNLLTI
nr:hypothetical protein [Tanacetum cinerariifolium]